MDEDYKKVVEATRVIAEVCKKHHHFDKEKHDIICHKDCPFFYHFKYRGRGGLERIEESCRLNNYPFDYKSEVEYFEEE